MRITHYGKVVWEEGQQTTTPQEEKMHEIEQPLHIPREALITRLKSNLADKRKKREEAEAAVKASRKEVEAVIGKFSNDELVNILTAHLYADQERLKGWAKNAQEEKQYVSHDSKPTPVEDKLEKTVRVLEMASDQEIEITPQDAIYPLL